MSISVVIPALNEAECIADAIATLRTQKAEEIIVVDGGSKDRTRQLSQGADIVVSSSAGRALQMNLGAARARGDILLFLHADCTLEDSWQRAVERCLARTGAIAGCFSMCARANGTLYRCIDWCAGMRVRLSGLIYGDQGLFLRRRDFEQLGGFPTLRFMEDVYFSKMLRRHGSIAVLPQQIFVSTRRWQKAGLIRQTLRNWTLTALAAAGVHPDRLVDWYPHVR